MSAENKAVITNLFETGRRNGSLTNSEILEAFAEYDFTPEQTERFYDRIRRQGIRIIEEAVRNTDHDDITSVRTVSEENSDLNDSLPEGEATASDDTDPNIMLKKQMEELLDTLTPREARVIRLRFGLVDGRRRTLEEVGSEFGVSPERIRQIEAKAIRSGRRYPNRSNKLKGYS